MSQIVIDETVLRALQRRAEQMARGELCDMGQAVCDIPAVEDLRKAIDVLGAHTKQGLQHQHAYIAALSTAPSTGRRAPSSNWCVATGPCAARTAANRRRQPPPTRPRQP